MNTKLVALLSLATLFAIDEARADVVTDRVLLVPGPGACGTNATGFKRIKQMPDGAQTVETTEFQVPYGSYLEITNVEYTVPYYTLWAKFYAQSIDVTIRQRYGTASTSVLSARYHNGSTYFEDGDDYVEAGQVTAPGAKTQVAAFPVGPLMGSRGRLCVAVTSNFWNYGGSIRVRGRLIPSGEPPIAPAPDAGKLQ